LLGLEEGGFVPEGVAIGVVFQDGIVVAPAGAGDVRQAFTLQHAEQMRGAVRRIVHRREAVAPRAFAIFDEERLQAGVMILALAMIETAELAFVLQAARGDGELLIVAGLGHHVGEARAPDGVDQQAAFLERHRGGHGAHDVFAGVQAGDGVTDMVRRGREEADGFDGAVFQEFVERGVSRAAAIGFRERLLAIVAQVGDGLHGAVGMFVKLERSAEAAAHNTDADLAIGGGGEGEGRGEQRTARRHDGHYLPPATSTIVPVM
jgi:hypothetical protein